MSPNAKRNLMLGALLGLALGIGLALLRHTFDTKVRTEDDVKALSNRPILGDIPMVKSVKSGLLSLESDPHGRHAESIRRLRTNILFVDVTTAGHSFVVTSSVPGEGKTTTTINLALAMADAGLQGAAHRRRPAQPLGREHDGSRRLVRPDHPPARAGRPRGRRPAVARDDAARAAGRARAAQPERAARLGADGDPLRQARRTTTTSSSSTAPRSSRSSTPCSSTS